MYTIALLLVHRGVQRVTLDDFLNFSNFSFCFFFFLFLVDDWYVYIIVRKYLKTFKLIQMYTIEFARMFLIVFW